MNKNKAKELSEILKAFSDGKIIQRQDKDGWHDISETYLKYFIKKFDEQILRIKPQPKLVPFTFEDNLLFKDRWFKYKDGAFRRLLRLVSYEGDCLTIHNQSFSYQKFLDNYIFEDGSPCGKYINE